MKSKNVWVIAIDTTNIDRTKGFILLNNRIEERRIAATRLMWIPGVRPVMVPARTPIKRARVNSKNIFV